MHLATRALGSASQPSEDFRMLSVLEAAPQYSGAGRHFAVFNFKGVPKLNIKGLGAKSGRGMGMAGRLTTPEMPPMTIFQSGLEMSNWVAKRPNGLRSYTPK